MGAGFRSIFRFAGKKPMVLPEPDKPLLRALEPRILLDAAAMETASEAAETAVRHQLADEYVAGMTGSDPEDAVDASNEATSSASTTATPTQDFGIGESNESVPPILTAPSLATPDPSSANPDPQSTTSNTVLNAVGLANAQPSGQPTGQVGNQADPLNSNNGGALTSAIAAAGQPIGTPLVDGAEDPAAAPAAQQQADDEEEAALDPEEEERKEIVFIDSAVVNIGDLIESLGDDVEIHILDDQSDGLQQIADILEGRDDIDAIHLFAHGDNGSIQLGSSTLDGESIAGDHADLLAEIGSSLTDDGDILIYGCNFGEGDDGKAVAAALALATDADIAASDDLTGAESLGGDWDLEVHVGEIQTTTFAAPDWEGLLGDFQLATNSAPTITHNSGGVIGTVGTTALWSNAGTVTLDGGGTLNIDVRATVINSTGAASVNFGVRSTTDNTQDDMRVIITNTGAIQYQSPDGGDVLAEGSATILWEIFEAGTNNRPAEGSVSLTISDIDGRDGNAQTREALSADLSNLSSYTLQSPTNLNVTTTDTQLRVDGTQDQNDEEPSWVQYSWNSANQLVLTYTTYTELAYYHHDGDGDLVFSNPNTQYTQGIDLDADNSSGATGGNYQTSFIDALTPGTAGDGPVSVADADIAIFDINDTSLEAATIKLTNASAGDKLNVNTTLLTSLGITAVIDDSVPGEITVRLSGSSLIENYETAIQSITYSNVNNSFDKSFVRVIEISASDGINVTETATTTIDFTTSVNNPVALTDTYVTTEDVSLSVTGANGLLANDSDPQGDTLNVTAATDTNGNAITIGAEHTFASGSRITINADGSFDFIPASHLSGVEFVRYTVSDGTNNALASATFNTKPVVDNVSLNVTVTNNTSNEDSPSNTFSLTASSPDTDGSEKVTITADSIPVGVIIGDGTNSFTSTEGNDTVDITSWNLNQLRITPTEHSDVDLTISFTATTTEVDGATTTANQLVTFSIDAVADGPILEVTAAGAPIGSDVSLVGKISATLADNDGSETVTSYRLENIPVGASILVNGLGVPVVGGAITLSPSDLDTLVFRPPAGSGSYTINVFATSTESNPENGVATATAETGPVSLAIDIDNTNDPVTANDDSGFVYAGTSVTIAVLDNDSVPDGGQTVTHIDGQAVNSGDTITLTGGQGTATLNGNGTITYNASTTYSGGFVFTYQVADVDGSSDTADVIMNVDPRWVITGSNTVSEAGMANYTIELQGQVQQGKSASVQIDAVNVDTTSLDYQNIYASIVGGIFMSGRTDVSLVGNTLVYNAPTTAGYTGVYNATGGGFNDISVTGAGLNQTDDDNDRISIGFDFNFYGTDYNELYVSSNGLITFGSGDSNWTNATLDGSASNGRALISVLWDDYNPAASGDVFYEVVGTPGNRQLIIQWDDIRHRNAGGSGNGTFQAVLHEIDGRIEFRYDDVNFTGSTYDNGASATIGVQSSDGQFYQYSHNAANITSGSTLTITQAAQSMADFTFSVIATDDTAFEVDEDYTIRLSSAGNSGIGTADATTTILQNDNNAPVARNDGILVNENDTVTRNVVTLNNGSGPDTDDDGHTMTITHINGAVITGGSTITLASGAQITVQTNGTITYDPNGVYDALGVGQSAIDTYTYTISDGFGGTSSATVTMTIQGLNVAPVLDVEDDGTTVLRDNAVAYAEGAGVVGVTDAASDVTDVDDTTFASL
ncbi:MAG: DUF4347 domain-containing protein, partial [Pseudomonadota bacterium]